jgi:hypothetical protein
MNEYYKNIQVKFDRLNAAIKIAKDIMDTYREEDDLIDVRKDIKAAVKSSEKICELQYKIMMMSNKAERYLDQLLDAYNDESNVNKYSLAIEDDEGEFNELMKQGDRYFDSQKNAEAYEEYKAWRLEELYNDDGSY